MIARIVKNDKDLDNKFDKKNKNAYRFFKQKNIKKSTKFKKIKTNIKSIFINIKKIVKFINKIKKILKFMKNDIVSRK